jgi:hypothetical protein
MNNLRLLKIFFILLMVIPFPWGITSFASDIPIEKQYHLTLRKPDNHFVEKYKARKEFNYKAPPVQNNFSMRILRPLVRLLDKIFTLSGNLPMPLSLMIWGALLAALAFIIVKTKIFRIFYAGKDIPHPEYQVLSGEENSCDYDAQISLLVEKGQFREAVRLLFLKLMTSLQKRELIQYSKDKTNRDYMRELTNEDFRSCFRSLSLVYNYVWYGNTPIKKEQYLNFEKNFQTFYDLINAQE